MARQAQQATALNAGRAAAVAARLTPTFLVLEATAAHRVAVVAAAVVGISAALVAEAHAAAAL